MVDKEPVQIRFDDDADDDVVITNPEKAPAVTGQLVTYAQRGENTIVVKSNDLIQRSVYDLSLSQQRLMLRIFAMLRPTDDEIPVVELSLSEFARALGLDMAGGSAYSQIRKTIHELRAKTIKFRCRDGTNFVKLPGTETNTEISWIMKAYITTGTNKVRLWLDPDIKPYVLHLQEFFTSFDYNYTVRMRSQYSISLYELCKSWQNVGTFTETVDALGDSLGFSYKSWTDVRRFVIDKARKEINDYTDIVMDYSIIAKDGHKVTKLRFSVTKKSDEETEKVLEEIDDKLSKRSKYRRSQGEKQELVATKDSDDTTPFLPPVDAEYTTIEFAAASNKAGMIEKLHLRADYSELIKGLGEREKDALDTVIDTMADMASDSSGNAEMVDGGNKRFFLAMNDIILSYKSLNLWFRAISQKYPGIIESLKDKSDPAAYLKKCIMQDLVSAKILIATYRDNAAEGGVRKKNIIGHINDERPRNLKRRD